MLLCLFLAGTEQENDTWTAKMTSGAEDNSGGWNTKAKDTSCGDGGKWEMLVVLKLRKFLIHDIV